MNNTPSPEKQVELLETAECGIPRFGMMLRESGNAPLRSSGIDILQINTGYICNLRCRHCHVDATPERREMMTRQTMQHCLDALEKSAIATIDITGGAPEMHPDFRWFIERIREKLPDGELLVRSNLTLLSEKGKYQGIPEFLRQHRVTIIGSLPCHTQVVVDQIRGKGVFDRSIKALQLLNRLGYGKEESTLSLNLVYNPPGPSLPGGQGAIEKEFRQILLEEHGIFFNHLYTITNMPINRFLGDLLETGTYCNYMKLLADTYNPLSINNLMCKTTLSVGWDGTLYDCDFNQMLRLPLLPPAPQQISMFNEETLRNRRIMIGQHCYGCTAGAGSSCQGSLL